MRNVYLDHAATTPLDPEVLDAMMPFLKENYGNPSSVHSLGRKSRSAIEEARNKVASIIGALSSEIVFTGGATEANNTAICTAVRKKKGCHIVTSATEHDAVIEPCENYQKQGYDLSVLKPESDGHISAKAVESALKENTALISIMHTNNETGVENEIEGIGKIKGDSLFHCDFVQAAGKRPLNVKELNIDLGSMSAHKFYGPKGVGALYINSDSTAFESMILGGKQEQGRRAGTENVAGIVGLAKALELADADREESSVKLFELRSELIDGIKANLSEPLIFNSNIESGRGAAHIVSISLPPINDEALDGEMLLFNLDMQGIRASGGSACASGAVEPSHVLSAMGVDRATAGATVRLSMGKNTTSEEIQYVVSQLAEVVTRMRGNR